MDAATGCRTATADCAVNVLSEQCGDEIAGYARSLVSEIVDATDCTRQKRQLALGA